MKTTHSFMIILLSFTLFACGEATLESTRTANSQNGDAAHVSLDAQLAPEEAATGWQAMNAILDIGTQSHGQALSGVNFEHSFTHECVGGGSADFTGEVSANWAIGSAGADFIYTVQFNACSALGVSTDGTMNYSRGAEVQDMSLETNFEWNGAVTWSGNVSGECAIDVSGFTTVSLAGWNLDAQSETTGTICGFDASSEIGIEL